MFIITFFFFLAILIFNENIVYCTLLVSIKIQGIKYYYSLNK